MQASVYSKWGSPASRKVGSYGDLKLYAEALRIAATDGYISPGLLLSRDEGIGGRVRGLLFVSNITNTLANDLISELQAYGWIQRDDTKNYKLTGEGAEIVSLASQNFDAFRLKLLVKMHRRFTVPGWFVQRLQSINAKSGDVILPAPPKAWKPARRTWTLEDWNLDLLEQAERAYDHNKRVSPEAFPIAKSEWLESLKRSIESHPPATTIYAPRGFLARIMRKVTLDILFSNFPPGTTEKINLARKHPIPPRSFKSWCPLLSDLGLIYYTDYHPEIIGRLIFPCAGFRESKNSNNSFKEVREITNPQKSSLFLYRPVLDEKYSIAFRQALVSVYAKLSKKSGARYISLLDLRDEVCRRLRLGALLFERYLESISRQSVKSQGRYSIIISLESDIRPEQQSGHGLLRRPVYIDGIPHSLVSISHL